MNKCKKVLSLLLALLMVCTMIPFATVSAADEPTIEIVVKEEELNIGDEFEVTVNLLNIPEPGLIGAKVELDYDQDALELVTYYDEDEEDTFNKIEIGSKYNASSNKYITFGPLGKCSVLYLRGTANENQTRYEEHFYTATFKVKDNAVSGDYTITIKNYTSKDFVRYGNLATDFAIEAATFTINGVEPPATCEHEYDNDCDADCNLCGETREPNHTYLYECEQYCYECGEKTNPGAKHSILHVEAKEAGNCIEHGNVEYWYCEYCNLVGLDAELRNVTNMMSVRIYGACVSDSPLCKDGTCINCGLPFAAEIEHTYANACDADCDVCGTVREEVGHNWAEGTCSICGEASPSKVEITKEPSTGYAQMGEKATVKVTAEGEGLRYEWYIKNNGSKKYSKSSVTKSSYSVTMTDKVKDRLVFCRIYDQYGNMVQCKTVRLREAVSLTKEPATAAYAQTGKKVSVKITASGDGLKYTWYIKNDGATKYSKSSVTSATYSTTMGSKVKGRRVYCIVTDAYGKTVQTKTFILRESVSIITQPKTVTVVKNKTAKVTVKASGDGLKYTWYIKNEGATKYSKSSVTTSSYSTTMTSKSKNRLVYCVVTDKYGNTVKTVTIKLKMK